MNDADLPLPAICWPLHPPPWEYETLDRWVERLADAYGVSSRAFCHYALGLQHEDMHRLGTDPPEEVLRRLAAGTAVPIERLREMTFASTLQRCLKEVEFLLQESNSGLARWLRDRIAKGDPTAGNRIWDARLMLWEHIMINAIHDPQGINMQFPDLHRYYMSG